VALGQSEKLRQEVTPIRAVARDIAALVSTTDQVLPTIFNLNFN